MPALPPATRRGSLWIALAIVIGMAALYMAAPRVIALADGALYDEQFRIRGARPGDDRIAVVTIDEPSLRAVGRWPWPRSVLATLVERLHQAGAAAIAFDVIMNEPERSGALRAASRILERFRAAGIDGEARRVIETTMREADHDQRLADAIKASGRVVLPDVFALARGAPTAAPERQGQPLKSAILRFRGYDQRGLFPPLAAGGVGLPIPALLGAAAGIGHVNMLADLDGATRWEALAIEYHGYYYPSLALETVRVAAGLEPSAVTLDFGTAVRVGDVAIPTDARARVLVDYAGPASSFHHYSAADVLAGRVSPDRLRNRIVFVGATAEGLYDLRVTPFSPVLPGVYQHANVAANILEGRFITRPVWVEIVEAASLVILPLLLGWLLPMLRPITSLGAALALEAALFAGVHLAFRRGLWLPMTYPALSIAATFVGVTVFRFLTEERQRLWTKRAFQRYVSPDVVEQIVEHPEALHFGGEVRKLTVLFCDIRGFTTFAERHDPQEVVVRLREHLTHLTARVLEQGGTLDKYMGDAIMAIFGAPIAMPDHAERACRAALAMTEELERLRVKAEGEGKEAFRVGIGIHTDDMVVGNLGSEQVFTYTVVGDGVNIGSRLETLNKDYRTDTAIIISESTYEAARDVLDVRTLGEVTVKGKTRPVAIYELRGVRPRA